jgi:ATP-dependent helicase/DNAse subunit B
VLHLEELKEPEEGPDVMQRGSIYHEILELTYRQIQKKKLTIAPENADRAVDILQTVAKDVFKQAAGNHGFRESPVWLHEYEGMLRQLIRLVQLDFSEANPFRLGARESKAAHPVAAALGSAPRVPFGQEKRFTVRIDGPAGSMVTSGVIDRIDLVGDQVVIVDYKSGSTKHPTQDMIDGRDYQMMIYVLAAQQILDRPVAGGLFWHISNLTVSGEIMTTDIAIEQAQTRLHGQILAAREGFFGVSPNQGRCFAHCEYGGLCRFGRGYTQKPVYPSP